MVSLIWKRIYWRLFVVLRPRLTWRYMLATAGVSYLLYCFLLNTPFFSSNLPGYTGVYDVGIIDIEVPCTPQLVRDLKFKTNNEPAFKLETILFTLFYPINKGTISKGPLHQWVPKPVSLVGEGFAKLIGLNNFATNAIFTFCIWSLAGGITIPAQVDAPIAGDLVGQHLLAGHSGPTADEDSFPVMLFSHGFASSRTDYTQYLGELASRGYVIAAIEHRDGSGPGTVITSHGVSRSLLHFDLGDLVHEDSFDIAAFKEAQLDFREAEVEAALRVLREINDGRGENIFAENSYGEGENLKEWRGRLAIQNTTIGGHSFGATLALQTLKGGPSEKLPFTGAIVLDPGKSSGPLNHDIQVPILIIHSNSWSRRISMFYGRPHFDTVKDLAQNIINDGRNAWFLTSLGTSHPSVTDAPLIEPLLLSWATGTSISAHEGINQYVVTSGEFLQRQNGGSKLGLLAECVTHPAYNMKDPAWEQRDDFPEMFKKYWQIHVAPCNRGEPNSTVSVAR